MKKINLILCAAAVACAGFFASCSNGAPEITFVNETTTKNLYSVTGSFTKITANNTVTSGVASTTDTTTTNVNTITKGYSTISWTEYATDEGNKSRAYTISFDGLKGTRNEQVVTGTTTTTAFDTNPEEESFTSRDFPNVELYKIDDDFYVYPGDGQIVKVSAENLESGDDFTLSFEYSVVEDRLGERLTTDTDVSTRTKTYKGEFKFAAVK